MKWMERNEGEVVRREGGEKLRGRRERGSEEDG